MTVGKLPNLGILPRPKPKGRPGDITLKLQQRLASNELRLEEILADTGYSNGSNYALLEQWNITDGPPLRLDTRLWSI